MKLEVLQDLFVEELRDIYSAEKQIIKALPKMAKAACSPKLEQAFRMHLEETKVHVERLETIFQGLGKKPTGKTCKGMKGLLEEGDEMANEEGDEDVLDAGLISAAQRVEHYEIAAYGCARTYAKLLGNREAERLLQTTLNEEGTADKKLTALAESQINIDAAESTAPAKKAPKRK